MPAKSLWSTVDYRAAMNLDLLAAAANDGPTADYCTAVAACSIPHIAGCAMTRHHHRHSQMIAIAIYCFDDASLPDATAAAYWMRDDVLMRRRMMSDFAGSAAASWCYELTCDEAASDAVRERMLMQMQLLLRPDDSSLAKLTTRSADSSSGAYRHPGCCPSANTPTSAARRKGLSQCL